MYVALSCTYTVTRLARATKETVSPSSYEWKGVVRSNPEKILQRGTKSCGCKPRDVVRVKRGNYSVASTVIQIILLGAFHSLHRCLVRGKNGKEWKKMEGMKE